ncbi:MAG: hypothetical protein JW808_00960 [Victivallales bacterium]|nr:hypothetical protein [Victivallales bacterium]
MITICLALMFGGGVYLVLGGTTELNLFWRVFFGVLGVLSVQLLAGLYFRKKVGALTGEIQRVMQAGQERIQRKVNMFQQKPAGGVKHMQMLIEKDQKASLLEAVSLTENLKKYYLWSPLLGRQVATMQMQFYYQMGDFAKVDRLLPKCLLMEHLTVAMKLARQYKNNDPALDKTFRSKIRKYKGDEAALLYSLYAWILLKRGEKDKAFELLTKAKEKTEHEVILKNWEHLANDKPGSFSNAGLGEEWYALRLESVKGQGSQKKGKRFK